MKKIIASLLSLLTLTAGAVGAEFSEEETFSETRLAAHCDVSSFISKAKTLGKVCVAGGSV